MSFIDITEPFMTELISVLSILANWGGVTLASIALLYDICLRIGGRAAQVLWNISKLDLSQYRIYRWARAGLFIVSLVVVVIAAGAAIEVGEWSSVFGSGGLAGFLIIWNKLTRTHIPFLGPFIKQRVALIGNNDHLRHQWLETQSILIATYGIIWEIIHKLHLFG